MISGSSLVEGDEKQDRQDTSKYRFLPKKAIFLTQDRQRLLKSIGLASAGQYLWQKSAASTTVKQNLDAHAMVNSIHLFGIAANPWAMELFSSRRWRLDRPKQKAVVSMLNPKIYATHAWHIFIVVWLLGWLSCRSPYSKELYAWADPVARLLQKNSMAEVFQTLRGWLLLLEHFSSRRWTIRWATWYTDCVAYWEGRSCSSSPST